MFDFLLLCKAFMDECYMYEVERRSVTLLVLGCLILVIDMRDCDCSVVG